MKNYTKAKECYLKGLNLSADVWYNATPGSNKIIRQICVEEKAGLADLELAFMDRAPYGLLGREQFYDNCHWYSEYHDLVTEQLILEIAQNNIMYPNIIISNLEKLESSFSPYNFSSLKEYNKDMEIIKRHALCAIKEIVYCENDKIAECAISNLETH